MAGVGTFQVDKALLWERRLVVGVADSCGNNERLLMGGVVGQRKDQ